MVYLCIQQGKDFFFFKELFSYDIVPLVFLLLLIKAWDTYILTAPHRHSSSISLSISFALFPTLYLCLSVP